MTDPISLGYNPIRWRCETQGCFNVKCRPKVEMFADCFPGRINFGDLDYWVEMSGFFLLLEWKHPGGMLMTGQARAFEAFTKLQLGNVVFIVEGDEETMTVKRCLTYWDGRQRTWQPATLTDVKNRFLHWVSWVQDPDVQQGSAA